MKSKKCETHLCDNPIKYPGLGICQACYMYYRYWNQKGVAKTLKRRKKLALWQERIDNITGTKRIQKRKAS